MLERATVETFAPHVGEPFRVALDGGATVLVLGDATPAPEEQARAAEDAGLRAPFSIVFRGPAEPLLAQGTYRLEHAALGAFELFVVPVGRDGDGIRYEAVFG